MIARPRASGRRCIYSIICCLGADAGPGAQPGRRHRHHRVGRRHRRLLRRVLRAAEGRGAGRARRSAASTERGFQRAFRTILAADVVVASSAPSLLYCSPSARCAASPSSSACRRSSTSSSPASSPGPLVVAARPQPVLHRGPLLRRRPRPRPGAGGRRPEVGHDRDASRRREAQHLAPGSTTARPTFDFVGRCEAVVRHLRRRHRCIGLVVARASAASTSASTSRAARVGGPGRRRSRSTDAAGRHGRRRARRRQGADRSTADGDVRLRRRGRAASSSDEASRRSRAALAELTGIADVDEVEPSNTVGPSWGDEISREGRSARSIFFLVAHRDLHHVPLRVADGDRRRSPPSSTTSSSRSACTRSSGFEVTPATVIAFLTILGFSIYDSIVVFDKVDENTKPRRRQRRHDLQRHGQPVAEPGADAVAQHVDHRAAARSSRCSIVGSFILGATTLQEFALALLIGLFAGAYSSIFIASPLLALLKEREPRYRGAAQAAGPSASGRDRARPTVEAGWPVRRTRRRRRPSTPATGRRRRPRQRRPGRGRPARPGADAASQPPRPRKKAEAALTDAPDAAWLRSSSATSPTSRSPGIVFKDITPLLADADALPARASTPSPSTFAGRGDRPGGRHRGPRASSSPRRSPTGSAPASSRSARPGKLPWRGRARGVRARVRHRPARDPPRRRRARASGC